ncbi:spore germination protein KB [Paenibacillus phyllosphaerae]|uniref:Spore germination protein KB n=1 Tax=Paenibacillus phyllosphaerae TaxID=274593 RepID=A0A7W5B3I6_9BACL|nr:endospore germination permease [Paenibacillus phyllosphaerae]MBB3113567.1 spore germination protein KB [Paenibacillus phyllosphaerae]
MNVMYAKAIGITQGIIGREVNSDMWLSTVLGILQGVAVAYIVAKLMQYAPEFSMVEMAGKLIGTWAGKGIAVLIFLFFLGTFATVMVTFVYHLMDYFLPEAPTILFVVAALMVGLYGAYHGLEVMSRMAFVGVFSMLTLNILVLFGSVREMDVRNILPVMDSGLVPTLWASRHFDTDWAFAVMLIALLLPHVKRSARLARVSAVSVGLAGISIVMWPIMESTVLSAEATSQYIVACMQLARSAHIGLFLHRYEMIMIAFFATSSLIQVMMCLFCASLSASKLLGLKDYRPMLLPTGAILGAFAYWIVADHMRAMEFTAHQWPLISLPIVLGLPLVIGILYLFFKDKLKANQTPS